MKELVILILLIIPLFVAVYFTIKNNKEKYIDLGEEINKEIQNAAASKLTSTTPKLDTIKTNMNSTNTSLDDIISSQTTTLNNITDTVTNDISDLTDINNKLNFSIKKVKKLINGTVIPVTENFENISSSKKQNNLNNKDKLTEYFYNYVPPKQNVYEGFFDWKDEWNRKVSDIGLSLTPSSVIKAGKSDDENEHHDEIPLVFKPNMTENMNKTTAKIISLAVTNNEQDLLQAWRRNIREN
jgi:hypothetical protein